MGGPRLLRLVGLTVGGLVAASLLGAAAGVVPGVGADEDEDVTVLDNVPAALDALRDGLDVAAEVASETRSAEATSAAVGRAFVNSGSALVAATGLHGTGEGLALLDLAVQQALSPVTTTLDDPGAGVTSVVAGDVPAVLSRLRPAVGEVLFGPGGDDGVLAGLGQLLRGNVIAPPNGLGPAFWSYAVLHTMLAGYHLTDGTPAAALVDAVGVGAVVVGAAVEADMALAEDVFVTALDTASPVPGLVIGLLGL